MNRQLRIRDAVPTVVLLLATLLPVPLGAQLPSAFVNAMPNEPGRPAGYTYLETGWGSPNADDTTPIVLRQDWNSSRVSLTLGVAGLIAHNDAVGDGFSAGIGAGYDLLPVPAAGNQILGVRVYTGLAYASHAEMTGTIRQWDVPIALGAGLVLPAGPIAAVAWVAPEARLRAVSSAADDARFDPGGGVQFGIRVTKQQLAPGARPSTTRVGLQISGGVLFIDDLRSGHSDVETFIRIGGHWTYQL